MAGVADVRFGAFGQVDQGDVLAGRLRRGEKLGLNDLGVETLLEHEPLPLADKAGQNAGPAQVLQDPGHVDGLAGRLGGDQVAGGVLADLQVADLEGAVHRRVQRDADNLGCAFVLGHRGSPVSGSGENFL